MPPTLPPEVIERAKKNAQVEAEISLVETGIAVCQDEKGNYRMYKADAWIEPTQKPLLPWKPPPYKPIAVVDKDGNVKDP